MRNFNEKGKTKNRMKIKMIMKKILRMKIALKQREMNKDSYWFEIKKLLSQKIINRRIMGKIPNIQKDTQIKKSLQIIILKLRKTKILFMKKKNLDLKRVKIYQKRTKKRICRLNLHK